MKFPILTIVAILLALATAATEGGGRQKEDDGKGGRSGSVRERRKNEGAAVVAESSGGVREVKGLKADASQLQNAKHVQGIPPAYMLRNDFEVKAEEKPPRKAATVPAKAEVHPPEAEAMADLEDSAAQRSVARDANRKIHLKLGENHLGQNINLGNLGNGKFDVGGGNLKVGSGNLGSNLIVGDGKLIAKIGDGKLIAKIGDGKLVDGKLGDGKLVDGKLADGKLIDVKLGDGTFGDNLGVTRGDDNRYKSRESVRSGLSSLDLGNLVRSFDGERRLGATESVGEAVSDVDVNGIAGASYGDDETSGQAAYSGYADEGDNVYADEGEESDEGDYVYADEGRHGDAMDDQWADNTYGDEQVDVGGVPSMPPTAAGDECYQRMMITSAEGAVVEANVPCELVHLYQQNSPTTEEEGVGPLDGGKGLLDGGLLEDLLNDAVGLGGRIRRRKVGKVVRDNGGEDMVFDKLLSRASDAEIDALASATPEEIDEVVDMVRGAQMGRINPKVLTGKLKNMLEVHGNNSNNPPPVPGQGIDAPAPPSAGNVTASEPPPPPFDASQPPPDTRRHSGSSRLSQSEAEALLELQRFHMTGQGQFESAQQRHIHGSELRRESPLHPAEPSASCEVDGSSTGCSLFGGMADRRERRAVRWQSRLAGHEGGRSRERFDLHRILTGERRRQSLTHRQARRRCGFGLVFARDRCRSIRPAIVRCPDDRILPVRQCDLGRLGLLCHNGFGLRGNKCELRFRPFSRCPSETRLLRGRCTPINGGSCPNSHIEFDGQCLPHPHPGRMLFSFRSLPAVSTCPTGYIPLTDLPLQTTDDYPLKGVCGRLVPAEMSCPTGFSLEEKLNRKERRSGSGGVLDGSEEYVCRKDFEMRADGVECETGFEFDTASLQCVKTTRRPLSRFCERGALFGDRCVEFTSEASDHICPEGYEPDPQTNNCVKLGRSLSRDTSTYDKGSQGDVVSAVPQCRHEDSLVAKNLCLRKNYRSPEHMCDGEIDESGNCVSVERHRPRFFCAGSADCQRRVLAAPEYSCPEATQLVDERNGLCLEAVPLHGRRRKLSANPPPQGVTTSQEVVFCPEGSDSVDVGDDEVECVISHQVVVPPSCKTNGTCGNAGQGTSYCPVGYEIEGSTELCVAV